MPQSQILTPPHSCVNTSDFESAYAEACKNGEQALNQVARKFPAQWCELASRLANENDSAALAHLKCALSIPASNFVRAGILNDVGRIHANAGQTKESLGYFLKAHALHPQSSGILANIALAHRWSGDLKSAESWLLRSLKAHPWEHNAALELSFIKLLGGDYLNGFEHYESRFRVPGGSLKKLICDKPEWDGTNGKRVFIYGEQGAGDIYLMLRYSRLIKARGVWQSWGVHKPMMPLVSSIPEIDHCFWDGKDTPDFDCHIPAASLPRLFKTTIDIIPSPLVIPRPVPHDYGEGFHVGIVWRGSKAQNNDHIRSTQLKEWLPVLNVPGVTFHSLQVDGADEALAYPQINMDTTPADWMETAKRVCGLDLVITVDTSMVHLCGSLGVPCWCALHCRPYFVFPLVREDCPWYPSVKLFKQKREFEWREVFENITNELREKTLLPRQTR
jgi:hypothetical protein